MSEIWWDPTTPTFTYTSQDACPVQGYRLDQEDGTVLDAEILVVVDGQLVVDSDKQAAKAARLAADALRAQIEARKRFGQEVVDDMVALNITQNRTAEQRRAIAAKTQEVQLLLLAGSLESAVLAIQSVEPDEFITEPVKAAFVAKINEYLGV